jgi:hypothetical protein
MTVAVNDLGVCVGQNRTRSLGLQQQQSKEQSTAKDCVVRFKQRAGMSVWCGLSKRTILTPY